MTSHRRAASPLTLLVAAALLAALAAAPAPGQAQGQPPPGAPDPAAPAARGVVRVVTDAAGQRLQVDGRDFMVLGVNWDHSPIGTNYAWSLFEQPDDVVEEALSRDMPLLKAMGVNAIRVYAGMPPRWVRWVWEKYGIYTVVNHTVGRYGYMLDGVWSAQTDYSNPRLRAALKAEVTALVKSFQGTPGVLMWLLGNENNYGLSWSSFEIEALPQGERDAARARQLYSLFGEIIGAVKALDPDRPVAIANGDVQYIDLIASECRGLDVLGTNVYRGASARDLFDVVKAKLGVPVMFTEFGADAWDARRQREDDVTQARYLVAQWREIYEQSAGHGRAGNAIGGFVFQWADGWWKTGQESNLDVHDTTASWPNGGYAEDFVEGANNMNEEWWGLCAKGPADARGLYDLFPRTGYYALQQAWRLPPYAPTTDAAAIAAAFSAIDLGALSRPYRSDKAALAVQGLERVKLTTLRANFQTYSTGASNTDPAVPPLRGFDHLESFWLGARVQPAPQLVADLVVNVVGNVPLNPIDEIFYEKRGRQLALPTTGPFGEPGTARFSPDRLKIYAAKASWDEPWFKLDVFHRTGHYHWGSEGDFFGLYREANYGPNIDTYDADAPSGAEVAFKQSLAGLKVAFGPQLWWGANPEIMAKYRRTVGPVTLTLQHEEQLAKGASVAPSGSPEPLQRKTALVAEWQRGRVGVQAGAILAGASLVGDTFNVAENAPGGGYTLSVDHVVDTDTLGGKLKVTWETGRWHWYAQGAFMGLVANAGPTAQVTYTGWSLKDSGSGNQANGLMGLAVNVGDLQIAPNFLWQKPLVGPVPREAGPLRNVLDDPFAVRANRETVAGELLLTWDPTPATWMWQWDNDLREDAPLAASLDLVYRHQPTSRDAGLGFLADGVTQFAFTGAPPARDLWEATVRLGSRPSANVRLVGMLYGGLGEPNGDSQRAVHRWGAAGRVAWRTIAFHAFAKVNDWGPYDYHRDFNLTFPLQLMGDLSYTLSAPRWLGLDQTKVGVRGTLRYLDRDSNRFKANPADPLRWGDEYEIRTYVDVAL